MFWTSSGRLSVIPSTCCGRTWRCLADSSAVSENVKWAISVTSDGWPEANFRYPADVLLSLRKISYGCLTDGLITDV
uniref:Uncharacterized protein n=1 Tax=Bracon brevicornis TaxID=1563983 RepID=A0A6V7KTY2_9HYME